MFKEFVGYYFIGLFYSRKKYEAGSRLPAENTYGLRYFDKPTLSEEEADEEMDEEFELASCAIDCCDDDCECDDCLRCSKNGSEEDYTSYPRASAA